MTTSLMAGAAVAACLALAGPAVAYEGVGVPLRTQPVKPDLLGTNSLMMLPPEGAAAQLIGAPVYDQNNDCVGRVAYVLFAPPNREIAAVVISVSMFLYSKPVAVLASDIARAGDRLVVDQSKRDLQRSVAFRP